MYLDNYQAEALTLALPTAKTPAYLVPGLAAEAGELAGVFAKAVRKSVPPEKQKIIDELGDVLWFVAVLAATYQVNLSDVAAYNLHKLKQRVTNNTLDALESRKE